MAWTFPFAGVCRLIGVALAVGYLSLVPVRSEAATIPFSGGGTCDVILQGNGYRLDKCVNKSGKTANDLHVTFSSPGLPNRTLNIVNAFLCGIITTCDFGSDVPDGGTWEGIGGSTGDVANPTIWTPKDLEDAMNPNVNLEKIKATGNWTINGEKIAPVPIGATLPMAMLGLGALLGLSTARKRRLALH